MMSKSVWEEGKWLVYFILALGAVAVVAGTLAWSKAGAVPNGNGAVCTPTACGTTEGTKSETVCDYDCPTFKFEASRLVCPEGYDPHGQSCRKWFIWHYIYADKVTQTFGPIDIKYDKSNDPNKCHKPTSPSLNIPSWAVNDYEQTLNEWENSLVSNCHEETVKCEAEIIACPTSTPEPSCTPTPTDEPETTPTPDPEVTPTPTEEPKREEPAPQPQNGAGDWPSAYMCPNGEITILPLNPHVLRNGDTAIIKFVPTGGDRVDVLYKEVNSPVWTHALRDEPNDGYLVIDHLNPQLGYTFGIIQRQGCSGGQLLLIGIVDGPETNMFLPSFWEWR